MQTIIGLTFMVIATFTGNIPLAIFGAVLVITHVRFE